MRLSCDCVTEKKAQEELRRAAANVVRPPVDTGILACSLRQRKDVRPYAQIMCTCKAGNAAYGSLSPRCQEKECAGAGCDLLICKNCMVDRVENSEYLTKWADKYPKSRLCERCAENYLKAAGLSVAAYRGRAKELVSAAPVRQPATGNASAAFQDRTPSSSSRADSQQDNAPVTTPARQQTQERRVRRAQFYAPVAFRPEYGPHTSPDAARAQTPQAMSDVSQDSPAPTAVSNKARMDRISAQLLESLAAAGSEGTDLDMGQIDKTELASVFLNLFNKSGTASPVSELPVGSTTDQTPHGAWRAANGRQCAAIDAARAATRAPVVAQVEEKTAEPKQKRLKKAAVTRVRPAVSAKTKNKSSARSAAGRRR